MELEMEATADVLRVDDIAERLTVAAAALEAAAERIGTLELEASASREAALATRLAEAEATIASLRASATQRKTAPALTAREPLALEAGALDSALSTLSLEQRIAVKAQLLRTGILG